MRLSRSRTHPRDLLVDTNLLVLLAIGSFEPGLIERHKRTRQFTVADYRLLRQFLARFRTVVSTPNVLTEASNLVDQGVGAKREGVQALLASIIGALEEHYIPSQEGCGVEEFQRLGLADSAILHLAQSRAQSRRDLLVLTDDLHLYLALQRRGLEAVNFNHLREQSWS